MNMKILITGASRGIGAACAKKFAESGNSEIFLVSRNKEALNKLKADIDKDKTGSDIHVLSTDLEKEENIRELMAEIKKKTKRLDIILNNAGNLVNKDFARVSLKEINRIFSVNYTAPAIIIKEGLPLLKEAIKPHVVNISSMGGFQGSEKFPGLSHYSASKAALAVLTECLAVEFRDEISFNSLAIGSVQTEMLEEAFPGYKAPLQPD
ncbi:MAG: SDR family NAD(P)-dependent oxidoreductase, partial [Bacteroidota bacterium]